jgi:uncharacterized membrane protein
MQTIKTKDHEPKRSVPFKVRFQKTWVKAKKVVPITLAVLFVEVINLLLTIFSNSYSEGIFINIVIVVILIASVSMDIYNHKLKAGFRRKIRQFLRNLSIFLTPFILLFTGMTIMSIAFIPDRYFPVRWDASDNNCARVATVDKFRVSSIELEHPMTFKIEKEDLEKYINDWIKSKKYDDVSILLPLNLHNYRTITRQVMMYRLKGPITISQSMRHTHCLAY